MATELLTNTRAASAPQDAEIALRARCADDGITFSVSSAGPSLWSTERPMPDHARPRGRGPAIASALADTAVHNSDRRVTVTAHLADPA